MTFASLVACGHKLTYGVALGSLSSITSLLFPVTGKPASPQGEVSLYGWTRLLWRRVANLAFECIAASVLNDTILPSSLSGNRTHKRRVLSATALPICVQDHISPESWTRTSKHEGLSFAALPFAYNGILFSLLSIIAQFSRMSNTFSQKLFKRFPLELNQPLTVFSRALSPD